MNGPYQLNKINEIKIEETPGVFILSCDEHSYDFIGRAEKDLHSMIKYRWKSSLGYKYFWYESTVDEKSAYLLECELYHKHTPPDNLMHPYAPEDIDIKCPVEDCIWTL